MHKFKIIIVALVLAGLSSCNNGKSLQKYYVENQEDSDFMALDLPTSMFTNSEFMEAEHKATLESISKINVLALKKEEDPSKFETEKAELKEIFKDEKYQLLMRFGGSDRKAELYFTGEEDAIDELILYGYDNAHGLGVARVLGENMNPEKIMKLMKSLDEDNINVDGIKGLGEIFGKSHKDSAKGENHNRESAKDSINIDPAVE